MSVIYNLNIRKGWHVCKPVNERPHSDEKVRLKMHELRDRGRPIRASPNILNRLGYVPYKGRKVHRVERLQANGANEGNPDSDAQEIL